MDYKFGKAAGACTVCAHAFAEGEAFISALHDTAVAEGMTPHADRESTSSTRATHQHQTDGDDDPARFERFDICERCWQDHPREALFSWWLNAKEVRPPQPPTNDPELLWLLLGHTLATHDSDLEDAQRNPLAVHLGYLAALGLLRLKHVQLGRHRRIDGRSYQAFVPRESRDREIVVLDPEPSDEALAIVEQKLCAIAEEVRNGNEITASLRSHSNDIPHVLQLGRKPNKKKRRRTKKSVPRP